MGSWCEWLVSTLGANGKLEKEARLLNVEESQVSGIWDHFCRELTKVKLIFSCGGEIRTINLIMKTPPRRPSLDIPGVQYWKIFDREVKFYRELYPILSDIYQNKLQKQGPWPKFYGIIENRRLVFEQLNGYKPPLALTCPSLEQIYSSAKCLAEFHAVSKYLEQEKLYDFKPLSRSLHFSIAGDPKIIKDGMAAVSKLIEKDWEPEWQTYPERIRNLIDKSEEILERTKIVDTFMALSYGDFLVDCVAFKEDVVPDPKFIHFQTLFYGSSAYDLVFFLYSCLDNDGLKAHYDSILECYYETLKSTLNTLGVSNVLPTLDEIQKAINDLVPFALVVGPTICGFTEDTCDRICALKEAPNISDASIIFSLRRYVRLFYKKLFRNILVKCSEDGII